MSEKILILGGARFHGFQLAESLAKKGKNVSVLNRGNFRLKYPENIKHLIVDRNNQDQLKDILKDKKFDIVVDNNAYNPSQINILLEILKDNFNHYIFTSSVAVYMKLFSETGLKEEEATGIQEDTYHPGVKNYSLKKFAAEQAIRSQIKNKFTILRFPDIYGKGDFARKLTFFKKRIENNGKILLEEEVKKFSFINVDDVVKIFENVIGNKKCFRHTINFSDPKPFSYDEFFSTIYGDLYSKERVFFMPAQKMWDSGYLNNFTWNPVVNLNLSEKLMGKIKYTPFDKWSKETLNWEDENPSSNLTFKWNALRKIELNLLKKLEKG